MANNYVNKMISFKDEYSEEYDFLCKQSNASGYVCELIRRDRLNQQKLAGMSEERIEGIIIRVLGQYGLIGSIRGVNEPIEVIRESEVDISLLLGAMDLLEG